MDALVAHCEKTGEPLRHFVSRALSDALGLDHSTLFQVSTTGALVQGVYNKAVTVGGLRPHGDFGLGTFEGLDGEMVVLDGAFYQAHADGSITLPSDSASVPFATLTNFHPQHRGRIENIQSMSSLIAALDGLRRSDNLFFAVRLDGHFEEIYWRVACKVEAGVHLDKATDAQAEFRRKDIRGTMLGFWTPAYSRAIGVAGWHLHFLTEDRKSGGHVLGAKAASLDVQVHDLDKPEIVSRVLQAENRNRVMVFCRTKRAAQRLADSHQMKEISAFRPHTMGCAGRRAKISFIWQAASRGGHGREGLAQPTPPGIGVTRCGRAPVVRASRRCRRLRRSALRAHLWRWQGRRHRVPRRASPRVGPSLRGRTRRPRGQRR